MMRMFQVRIASDLHISWHMIEDAINTAITEHQHKVTYETEFTLDGHATIVNGKIEIEQPNYTVISVFERTITKLVRAAAVIESGLSKLDYITNDRLKLEWSYAPNIEQILERHKFYGTLDEYFQATEKPKNHKGRYVLVQDIDLDQLIPNIYDENDVVDFGDHSDDEEGADHGDIEQMHAEDDKAEREYREWREADRAEYEADNK